MNLSTKQKQTHRHREQTCGLTKEGGLGEGRSQSLGLANAIYYIYVGLHPTGLQGLYLPSFKPEERARSQQQRHQWFNGWGILHM